MLSWQKPHPWTRVKDVRERRSRVAQPLLGLHSTQRFGGARVNTEYKPDSLADEVKRETVDPAGKIRRIGRGFERCKRYESKGLSSYDGLDQALRLRILCTYSI